MNLRVRVIITTSKFIIFMNILLNYNLRLFEIKL